MKYSNTLPISFSCMRITGSNIVQVPELMFDSLKELEIIKGQLDIKGNKDEFYPVIMGITNQAPCDIKDTRIKMKILCITENRTEVSIESVSPFIELKKNKSLKATIFDFSGFLEAKIELIDVNYKFDDEISSHQLKIKDSFLINKNDISNPFVGYRNYEEMETCFLLQNYLQNGFPARGLLLKLIFKILDDVISNRGFDYEGEKYSFNEEEIPALKSMIQIDIMSKIMMYIEDLFTILIAIKDFNANYYKLLDKNLEDDNDKDLGDRIHKFTNETKLSCDWRSYKSDMPFPFTDTRFDFYSMIFI